MATTVKKLVLVRQRDTRANMFNDAPFKHLIEGEPLPIKPTEHNPQSGVSHYGFLVAGLKLKDIEALTDFWHDPETVPLAQVLDLETKTRRRKDRRNGKTIESVELKTQDEQIKYTLQQIGLEINTLALEETEA